MGMIMVGQYEPWSWSSWSIHLWLPLALPSCVWLCIATIGTSNPPESPVMVRICSKYALLYSTYIWCMPCRGLRMSHHKIMFCTISLCSSLWNFRYGKNNFNLWWYWKWYSFCISLIELWQTALEYRAFSCHGIMLDASEWCQHKRLT